MALIDFTYFHGEVNISNTDRIDVQESLNWFIAKHEPEMLTQLMGYALYKAFTTSPSAERFTDILSGKEYTGANGDLQKWPGLLQDASTFYKRSPIAAYVYYFYQRDMATQTTGVGEAATKTENAVRVSPVNKMVKAWNEAARSAQELIAFLEANRDTYPEFTGLQAQKASRYFQPINAFGI